jgi:hypothetical protein
MAILELSSFQMTDNELGGEQCVLSFGDYELSIISGTGAYASKKAPYEIAVVKNGNFINMPGITEEDDTVKGWLTKSDVDAIIKKMYFLTGTTPRQQ